MVGLLIEWQLRNAVIAAGVLLTLALGTVLGHRAHFWLCFFAPALGRRFPADSGAWLGLSLALLALSL